MRDALPNRGVISAPGKEGVARRGEARRGEAGTGREGQKSVSTAEDN